MKTKTFNEFQKSIASFTAKVADAVKHIDDSRLKQSLKKLEKNKVKATRHKFNKKSAPIYQQMQKDAKAALDLSQRLRGKATRIEIDDFQKLVQEYLDFANEGVNQALINHHI